MSPQPADYIRRTQRWVDDIIVGLNVCPFAQREVSRNSIRYQVAFDLDDNAVYDWVMAELELLVTSPKIETTLLILPQLDVSFEAFLNQAGLAQQVIYTNGLQGEFQLANFHPHYVFEGAAEEDPANYTNRAPHATLHLLREASVARAVKAHKRADDIPEHNIARLRELGLNTMQGYLRRLIDE
ncbi:DUF1415 domain-containing protein [Aliidiomarina maris]|uniref:DUF1415 domain-containing protein n=1 Tax=Aliidiomarina maris TaxID=531312 RepID=A0A327WVM1_9GAMM|nr:DUF1415 domain-containing protein [Aliidiomarina maris]RAJ96887.1 hypothetical protein B0I24_10798 [Aliidiomarina maris]RUO24175.1 DUF1415 domain-containing protein [Aliidiomarina maris]